MKRAGALLGAVLVAVTMLALPPAAPSDALPRDRQDEIQAEIDRLKEQYDEALGAEAELLAGIEVARGQERQLGARVAELQAALDTVQAQLADAERRLHQATTELDHANAQLAQTRADLQAAADALVQRAVDAYVGIGVNPDLTSLVFQEGDLTDVQARASYTDWLVNEQRSVIDERQALEEDAEVRAAAIAGARTRVEQERNLVAEREAEARALRDEQEAARAQAAAEVERQEDLIAEVQARRGDYEARIAALRRESDAIGAQLRAEASTAPVTSSGGVAPAARGSGQLTFPAPGYSVGGRRFGMQRHPVYGTYRMHSGVDIGCPTGAPLVAADSGVVIHSGPRGGYGNTVIVDHGGGISTLYAHQSATAVGTGQSVGRGQVVGYCGSTGVSTGSHLHFEVRLNGNPVDPMPYL